MNQSPQTYTQLTETFVNWAKTQSAIRLAMIVGSRARVDKSHPGDEWSDLDLVLFVTNPEQYLETTEWLTKIGNPWLTFIESTGAGQGMERRVLFEGGLDVDFAIFPVDLIDQMAATSIPADVADTLRRGVAVLLDKDGLWQRLQFSPQESYAPQPPTPAEFLELVNDFWYHTVWTAKKLRRGELWTAKGCSDNYMKWQLLQMVEWHAHASQGWDYDVWHRGRFLEKWASPQVVKGLQASFAHYDGDDLWRGLLATMDLFRWLAVETAEQLNFTYPTEADQHVTKFVQNLFADRK